jgi:uncharacterized membrane protein
LVIAAVAAAFAAAALFAGGSALQQRAAVAAADGGSGIRLVARLARQPAWPIGLERLSETPAILLAEIVGLLLIIVGVQRLASYHYQAGDRSTTPGQPVSGGVEGQAAAP